jgi:23S rRNA pseudouridine2457 synthase
VPSSPAERPSVLNTASIATTLLLHKPYGMLSQFTPEPGSRWSSLAAVIPVSGVYAAGRLDADSEGLLLLTNQGRLQQRLTDPRWGHWRRYWVQVEGEVLDHPQAVRQLQAGITIQGRPTLPARARPLPAAALEQAGIGPRTPPIRHRLQIPTSWLEIELQEGRNRQVRRMTAAVGLPTLRLIRMAIDLMDGGEPLSWAGLAPGSWRAVTATEARRLAGLISPGRGGRAGGGKSGQGGGGG